MRAYNDIYISTFHIILPHLPCLHNQGYKEMDDSIFETYK